MMLKIILFSENVCNIKYSEGVSLENVWMLAYIAHIHVMADFNLGCLVMIIFLLLQQTLDLYLVGFECVHEICYLLNLFMVHQSPHKNKISFLNLTLVASRSLGNKIYKSKEVSFRFSIVYQRQCTNDLICKAQCRKIVNSSHNIVDSTTKNAGKLSTG